MDSTKIWTTDRQKQTFNEDATALRIMMEDYCRVFSNMNNQNEILSDAFMQEIIQMMNKLYNTNK